MKQDEIDKYLISFFSGQANDEDKKQIYLWLEESENNKQVFDALKSIWEKRSRDMPLLSTEDQLERIWSTANPSENIKKKIHIPNYKKTYPYYFRVAAVIILALIASQAFYWFQRQNQIDQATLEYRTYSSKPGQRMMLQLTDGSKVWLNGESTIKYIKGFTMSSRVVELLGEGYFEVAKDSSRPFTVNTGSISTTALGTEFNIKAEKNNLIKIFLTEGSIRVKEESGSSNLDEVIKPGAMIVFDQNAQKYNITHPDMDEEVGWKKGLLVFDGDDLNETIEKIEKWYGVDIDVIGTPVEQWSLTARYKNERLKNVLDDVAFTKNFNYKITKNKVMIDFTRDK